MEKWIPISKIGNDNSMESFIANIVKENKCGYIANSPKEISECIVEAYNNKENLKLLSENSYNYANENFLWEDVARSTLKKYKTFIKGEQL